MYTQLKKEIVLWLLENENSWQRVNTCVNQFKSYIYNNEGDFLIGGEQVYKFIKNADTLLFKNWIK